MSDLDAAFARYVGTHEASRLVGLSARTLEKYRCYGGGPVYLKIGGRVVYRQADLEAWAEQTARTSTHDAADATQLAERAPAGRPIRSKPEEPSAPP
jgi:hypothetical protein